MGASQRKEAVAYFSEFATASTAPSATEFTERLSLYSAGLCSGSELFSLASPIARQLVTRNEETGRLGWLLAYVGGAFAPAVASALGADPAQLAALRVMELTLRHVLALVKGDSVKLLAMLEPAAAAAAPSAASNGTLPHATGNPAGSLCTLLMDYILKVTLTGATAPTHAAVARLLLTMTSSALHHSTRFREDAVDVFTEMIMSSSSLEPFLGVLLSRTVAWGTGAGTESAPLYAEGCGPALGSLLRVFGGGGRAAGGPAPTGSQPGPAGGDGKVPPPFFHVTSDPKAVEQNVYASCPTAELAYRHSASLMAVLVAHQKGNGRNPALEYLTKLPNTPAHPYPAILNALANRMPSCPAVCMLLYVLLNDHPTFLHDVLRTSQGVFLETVERVLLLTHMACMLGAAATNPTDAAAVAPSETAVDVDEDLLRLDSLGRVQYDMTVYAYPFINFMTSTLLMILSQDRVVNQLLCDHTCVTTFGVDRHQRAGARMRVASLALQVTCTGIMKAVNDRSEPLAAIFAPCMANISVFTHDMDTATAQRVVGLVLIMLRKIGFLDQALESAAQAVEGTPSKAAAAVGKQKGGNPYAQEAASDLVALGDMLIRQLRMIVEVLEGMLRGRDRRNEALVYELLYARDRLVGAAGATSASASVSNGGARSDSVTEAPLSTSSSSLPVGAGAGPGVYAAQARGVLENLSRLILSFEAEIASAASASSPAEIMKLIRRCTESGGGGEGQPQLTSDMDLLYSYEESASSYDFFGPYVWATMLSDGRWPGGVLWAQKVGALPLFHR